MLIKWLIKEGKIQRKGGEGKMRRGLIALCLIVGISLLCAYAYAAAEDYGKTSTTHTSYYYDALGAFLSGFAKSEGKETTVTDGEQVTTTWSSTAETNKNGKPKSETTTIETYNSDTGERTKTTRTTEYNRGKTGNGPLQPGGTTKTTTDYYDGEGEHYKRTESTSTHTKVDTVGGTEVVTEEETTTDTYGSDKKNEDGSYKDKGKHTSTTTSTTTRTYAEINGVVKVTDVETTGVTEYFGQGTDANGENPWEAFVETTHYEYDKNGNVIPTGGVTRKQTGTDENGDPTYTYYDANGAEITDQNNDGSIEDEIRANMTGSYSARYAAGVTNDPDLGWSVYTRTSITAIRVINGLPLPDWSYEEYSAMPIESTPPANRDPTYEGTVVGTHTSTSAANNQGETNTYTYVFVRTADGRVYVYRYKNNSTANAAKKGDKVRVSGNTYSGKARIIDGTSIEKL